MTIPSPPVLQVPVSLYNYCLWPYSPSRPLSDDCQPALALLLESFRHFDVEEYGYQLVSNLIHLLGPCKTVFGIKSCRDVPSWEFYFYDYQQLNRACSSRSIISCFPRGSWPQPELDDGLPYFMFSLELTLDQIKQALPPTLTLYLGNPGGTLFGGKSYGVDPETGCWLYQNSYHFYDCQAHRSDIAQHVASSLHLPRCFGGDLPFKIHPYLSCQTLCIAHKRHCDGLYFSGVTLASVLQFFTDYRCQPFLASFLSHRYSMFDYLLFDIGLDCQADGMTSSYPKTAIYASF